MGTVPAIPKYDRIRRDIVARITSGQLPPGAMAPSENEIIRQYGVSCTTARRALAEMAAAGWVERVKGRGTIVRRRQVERSVDRILGFTRNMIEAGRTPRTEVLSVRRLRGGLGARPLRGPVWAIRRLRLADDEPMMIETRHVSAELCPGIDACDLTGSLYDLYAGRYGLELVRVDQELSTLLLDREAAATFGVAGPLPAFRISGVTCCDGGRVLETEESIYRGDLYRFTVRATRDGAGERTSPWM
ncbi:MAG: GntR family transcriptional regulator [Planctomycetes bacterium]|nr:GntR family transcriptional regulator [Planctomycetota bacterium]